MDAGVCVVAPQGTRNDLTHADQRRDASCFCFLWAFVDFSCCVFVVAALQYGGSVFVGHGGQVTLAKPLLLGLG